MGDPEIWLGRLKARALPGETVYAAKGRRIGLIRGAVDGLARTTAARTTGTVKSATILVSRTTRRSKYHVR
jgi:hypothetical protein